MCFLLWALQAIRQGNVSGLKNGDSTTSTFWKCPQKFFVAHRFIFQNVGDISEV